MGKASKRTKKPKKATWFKHKGVNRNNKQLHEHASHPYAHPKGRWHRFPPTSRIKDRKGRDFRHTAQELQHRRVKTSYRARGGKKKRWD